MDYFAGGPGGRYRVDLGAVATARSVCRRGRTDRRCCNKSFNSELASVGQSPEEIGLKSAPTIEAPGDDVGMALGNSGFAGPP